MFCQSAETHSGRVIFFDPVKRFGFIEYGDGQVAFFHFNDGASVIVDEGRRAFVSPWLARATSEDYGMYSGDLPDPKKGDRLIFCLAKRAKGPRATPWAYARDWDRVKSQVRGRELAAA